MVDFDGRVQQAIALLAHPTSSKRRAGAKKLRRLRAQVAGPALISALETEIRNPRTWETQYHMVMALAECSCYEALPQLRRMTDTKVEHMVLVAVGDALVRLTRDPAPSDSVVSIIGNDSPAVAEGALRAVAILKLPLTHEAVRAILIYALKPEHGGPRFWATAAAPGWDGPEVQDFLTACLNDNLSETRRAARHALKKEYLVWKPL